MTMAPESGGTILNIPYAPKEVSHSNLVLDYVTTPRPSLIERVDYSNPMRPRMSFDLEIHDKKVTATSAGSTTLQRAISVIQAIQSMARSGKRVRIAYGVLESGLWYLLDMTIKSMRRDPFSDEIISATVSLSFIRGDSALSGSTNTGPISGGAQTTTKPVTNPGSGTTTPTKPPAAPAAKYYTTKKGDTLWAISLKFYGTGTKWQKIADANKIRDPKKLPIGKKLRIP